jgi:hypothetical protein
MSADGSLKFRSLSHPSAGYQKPKAERLCPLCHLPLRAHPPVLLKTGESVHVECYFRVQKHPRRARTN